MIQFVLGKVVLAKNNLFLFVKLDECQTRRARERDELFQETEQLLGHSRTNAKIRFRSLF